MASKTFGRHPELSDELPNFRNVAQTFGGAPELWDRLRKFGTAPQSLGALPELRFRFPKCKSVLRMFVFPAERFGNDHCMIFSRIELQSFGLRRGVAPLLLAGAAPAAFVSQRSFLRRRAGQMWAPNDDFANGKRCPLRRTSFEQALCSGPTARCGTHPPLRGASLPHVGGFHPPTEA